MINASQRESGQVGRGSRREEQNSGVGNGRQGCSLWYALAATQALHPRLECLCQRTPSWHTALWHIHTSQRLWRVIPCKHRTSNGTRSPRNHYGRSAAAPIRYWQWRVSGWIQRWGAKKRGCTVNVSMGPLFHSLWHNWPESSPIPHFSLDFSTIWVGFLSLWQCKNEGTKAAANSDWPPHRVAAAVQARANIFHLLQTEQCCWASYDKMKNEKLKGFCILLSSMTTHGFGWKRDVMACGAWKRGASSHYPPILKVAWERDNNPAPNMRTGGRSRVIIPTSMRDRTGTETHTSSPVLPPADGVDYSS